LVTNRYVFVKYPDVWMCQCTMFLDTVLRKLRFTSALMEILLKTIPKYGDSYTEHVF